MRGNLDCCSVQEAVEITGKWKNKPFKKINTRKMNFEQKLEYHVSCLCNPIVGAMHCHTKPVFTLCEKIDKSLKKKSLT